MKLISKSVDLRSRGFLNIGLRAAAEYERMAEALFAQRRIAEAVKYLEAALAMGADPRSQALRRWESWMLLGQFERAWREGDRAGGPLEFGRSRVGRIAVQCSRGIGDAIQFLRYAPALKQHCECLRVEAPPRLLPLLKFFSCIDEAEAVAYPPNSKRSDLQFECSDLPYVFRTTLDNIPSRIPYIDMPVERVFARREPLFSSKRFHVGIAWAAGAWNPTRSIPAAAVLPLAEILGVAYFPCKETARASEWMAIESGADGLRRAGRR